MTSQYTPSLDSIRRLDADTVEEVIHRSLKSILLFKKIKLSYLDRKPYKYSKDGGIEIALSIPDDISPIATFFKSNNVIIQSKATVKILTDKEIEAELNKIEVQNFLEAFDKVDYIIAYSKTKKFTSGKNGTLFKSHLKTIKSKVKKLYPHLYKKVNIDIWLTEDIKDLISLAPSSWELFPDSYLLQLRVNTLKEIERRNEYYQKNVFGGEFVANDDRKRILKDIQEKLLNNDKDIVEIRGNMGIGKTRLSYEVIKGLDLEDICLWIDEPNSPILNHVQTHLMAYPESIIVLFNDEVNSATLNRIRSLKQNFPNQVKALVVMPFRDSEAGVSNDETIVLQKMPDDELESIVKKYGFNDEFTKKIISICRGYPKLAIAICDKMTHESEGITTDQAVELLSGVFYDPCDNSKGWYRLLLSDDDRQILGALSILYEVGVKGASINELNVLSKLFNFQLNDARRCIGKNIKKGIIVEVNDFVYITPLILANHLASTTLKEYVDSIPTIITELGTIDNRKGRFHDTALDSFMERVINCTSDSEIKGSVFELTNGLDINFFQASLQNVKTLKFVTKLGHVYPEHVLINLEKIFSDLENKLLSFEEGRREVVRFLEKAAFYSDLFALSLNCLKYLAIYENETWANNSTGIFIGFFSPYLSGSALKFSDRADYLMNEVFKQENSKLYDDLLSKCLKMTIRSSHSRMSGHENAFVRPFEEPEGKRTVTYGELKDVKLRVFEQMKQCPKSEIKIEYFKCFASELRHLAFSGINFEKNGSLDYLLSLNNKIVNQKILSSLKNIIRFDKEKLGKERYDKFQQIIDSLMFNDFSSQLLTYLSHYKFDIEEEWTKLENSIFNELNNDPTLLTQHREDFLSCEISRSSMMFYQLGRREENEKFWPEIFKFISVEKYLIAADYLLGLADQGDREQAHIYLTELRNKGLITTKDSLRYYSNINTEKAQEELFKIVQELGEESLDLINYSAFTRDINEEKINKLISILGDNCSAIIKLLANKLEEIDLSLIKLDEIIENLSSSKKVGLDFWYVKEKFIPKTITIPKFKNSYIKLFQKCLIVVSGRDEKYSYDHNSFCSSLLKIIAKHYEIETYDLFYSFFASTENNPYLAAIHFKGWPYRVYTKRFLDIFKNDSKEICCKFLKFLPNEYGVFSEHAALLVRRFESDDDIASALSVLLFSTHDVVVGDFSKHYESLIEKFDEWAKTNKLKSNRIIKELRIVLDKRYQAELASEKEEKYFMNRDQG